MTNRAPEKLPDPWLFDSESLLRELDRCRELVLEISITHPQSARLNLRSSYVLALSQSADDEKRHFERYLATSPGP